MSQVWKQRFQSRRKLADTLQGHIYLAIDLQHNNRRVVVKETYKTLVESGKSRDGHVVHEDFHNETRILTYLSSQPDADNGFCRIIYEWESQDCFYYAMQFCEAELFKFISKSFAANGTMYKYMKKETSKPQTPCDSNDAHNWLIQIRSVFRQCVQCVYWMHIKGVCHLDLSLENTMIYKEDGLKIKIIDFGLAKHYNYVNNEKDKHFLNDKRVGKRGYMAPEVYNKMIYDSRRADVWSLGVMLFMMLVGAPPYKRATQRDAAFNYIINGMLEDVLKHWRRLRLISKDALDCMEKIFKWEKDRITMEQLIKHPFVDLGHLLSVQPTQDNNHYVRITNAVKEYHNRYALPMQSQYNKDGGDNKDDDQDEDEQPLITFTTDALGKTDKLVLPTFINACKEILNMGNVKLLDDFNQILTYHAKLNNITKQQLIDNNHNNHNNDNNTSSDKSLAELYEGLLDEIKNKSFIRIDNSIVIRRCFRNRLKCEDEKSLLEVYGKYNKNVINDDEHRMAMQIMDKIYFYFAYTYNFGYTFDKNEIKQICENEELSDDDDHDDDDDDDDNGDIDKMLFKIKHLLKRKKQELLKTSYGKQIYHVLKDRKTKFCTSSENHFNNKDSEETKEKEQKEEKEEEKEEKPGQRQQTHSIPGPSIKIFRNIKNRMQQYLIQMKNAPQTMNHREFVKFLKTIQIRSKKEDRFSSLKGITSDQWKALINKFDAAQMSEAYFLGLQKKQFGNTLKRTLSAGLIVKLHKVLSSELQIMAQKRFFTDKDRIEKCDDEEIIKLLLTVLKETDKMDIENDLDLTELSQLFKKEKIDGLKFINFDEEYIITNLIKPCLLHKFDDIDSHRFGKRFRYWPAYSDNKTNDLLNGFYTHHWYVRPKYNDIKDEILNNAICSITVNQWNRTVLYASKIIIKTIAIKQLKAVVPSNKKDGGSTSNSSYNKYGVKNNDKIRLEHLVPLLIYINLDFVAKKLVSTYNNNNEINNDYGTWIKYMKYHSQLSHLARLVRETIECYGTNKYIPTFYHISNKSIHPNSLNTRFFSPTSVTTSLNAAFILNNFNNNEIIYELNSFQQNRIKYFNCSWLSDYPNEHEHIICGGLTSQRIINIYDLYQSKNYNYYIKAIKMLINTIENKPIYNYDNDSIKKIGITLNSLMQTRYIQSNHDDDDDDEKDINCNYIDSVFKQICKNTRYAQINMNYILQSNLMKAVLCNNKNNSIRFDVLSNIFPNINKYLVILNDLDIDKQTKIIFNNNLVKFLKNINQNNNQQNIKRRSLKIQSIKFKFVDSKIDSSDDFKDYQPKFAQNQWKLNCFTFHDITTLSIDYDPNLKNDD